MTSQRHNRDVVADGDATAERPIPTEVLEATRAAVLAVGVRRTTLTDVARRAGVSRMTLYRLVPDVTTLILEGMTREFAALMADAEQPVPPRRTRRARAGAPAAAVGRGAAPPPAGAGGVAPGAAVAGGAERPPPGVLPPPAPAGWGAP